MRVLRAGVLIGLIFATLSPAAAGAAPGDIGVEGPSYAGASSSPTGEKPESKAWFNDGIWWASLWDTASSRYEIFRFSVASGTWTSTNVPLDTRSRSRADTLWDGNKLYVASHVFSGNPATGYPSNLYRFSYSAATDTYTLDADWPQQINTYRSESLVIDKDSTGQLWATWVQGASGSREVWMNRTTSGDSTWGTPFKLPGNGTSVDDDDISSVIAFGGDKIGVFWSNQKGSSFHFAVHDDSASDVSWGNSVGVYPGAGNADDHMNLKSLQTDGSGRVFAVVKTSLTGSSSASIVLLVRSNSAVWAAHTIWTKSDGLTRPIVMIDTSNSRIHAFAAKESGGPVYTKTSSLSSIGFSSGLGTTVMLDASNNDINNPTSTKQNVSTASGLLVLASNDTTSRYWHHFDSLGAGGGGNATPVCSGVALTVAQGGPGGEVAPSCTDADADTLSYAVAAQGTKGVASIAAGNKLRYVPNAGQSGSDSFTYTANDGTASSAPATVSVTITPTGGASQVTFTSVADTYVNSAQPTRNHGALTTLRSRGGTNQVNSYLRFTVSGVGTASGAVLRLYVSDASPDAGKLHRIADNSWSESLLYADQPTLGPLITDVGGVTLDTYREIDVSAYVTGDGTYSFAIIGENGNVTQFHSREGVNDPQLVVTP